MPDPNSNDDNPLKIDAQSAGACHQCRTVHEPGQCKSGKTETVNPILEDRTLSTTYEYIEPIGEGGMGTLYKARHKLLGRVVAIKFVHPRLVSQQSLQRFRTEGKAGAMLTDPAIIKVHHFDVTASGTPYLVMDFVEGETLSEVLKRGQPLSIDRFLDIFCQVAAAIEHAHENKVLHRDIKPSNIMLYKEHGRERIRILDFGIAKLIDDADINTPGLTKTGDAVGSPLYMSPEQAQGPHIDVRADIYSLGCTMYECLSGTPPFVGQTIYDTMIMHAIDEPVPLSQAGLGRKIPEPIERMVQRCIKKKPQERYQTISDLLLDLQSLRKSGTIGVVKVSAPKTDTSSRAQIAIVSAVVLLLIGGALTVIYDPDRLAKIFSGSTDAFSGDGKTEKQKQQDQENEKKRLATLGEAPKFDLNDVLEQPIHDIIQRQRKSNARYVDLEAFGQMGSTSDEVAEQLSDLTPAVDTIDLTHWKITDHGLEPIQHLGLKRLKIAYTNVKDLESLKHFPKLDHLDMDYTNPSKSGVEILSALPNLEELKLDGSSVSDTDLLILAKSKSLRLLSVRDCKNLTKKGLETFLSVRPDCVLYFNHNIWEDVSLVAPGLSEAQSLMKRGDPHAAEIKLEEELKRITPNHKKAKAVLLDFYGESLATQGKQTEAVRAYTQALNLYPHAKHYIYVLDMKQRLADSYVKLHELRKAMQIRLEMNDLANKLSADTIKEKRRAVEFRNDNYLVLIASAKALDDTDKAKLYDKLAFDNLGVAPDGGGNAAESRRRASYAIDAALLCCKALEKSPSQESLRAEAATWFAKARAFNLPRAEFEMLVRTVNHGQEPSASVRDLMFKKKEVTDSPETLTTE